MSTATPDVNQGYIDLSNDIEAACRENECRFQSMLEALDSMSKSDVNDPTILFDKGRWQLWAYEQKVLINAYLDNLFSIRNVALEKYRDDGGPDWVDFRPSRYSSCPVTAGSYVEVERRSGEVARGWAKQFSWWAPIHGPSDVDIVRYRVLVSFEAWHGYSNLPVMIGEICKRSATREEAEEAEEVN